VTPNPSDGLIQVSLTSPARGVLTLSVRSMTGAEVVRRAYQKTSDVFQQSLDLHTAPGGVYIVETRIGEATYRRRIVKR
jgi:hypothetical protein